MIRARTEEEADAIIEGLISKSKSKYITQGVAFNKESKSQMLLLKMALMYSYSFGGLIKELIADKFLNEGSSFKSFENTLNNNEIFKTVDDRAESLKNFEKIENTTSSSVGNFL